MAHHLGEEKPLTGIPLDIHDTPDLGPEVEIEVNNRKFYGVPSDIRYRRMLVRGPVSDTYLATWGLQAIVLGILFVYVLFGLPKDHDGAIIFLLIVGGLLFGLALSIVSFLFSVRRKNKTVITYRNKVDSFAMIIRAYRENT